MRKSIVSILLCLPSFLAFGMQTAKVPAVITKQDYEVLKHYIPVAIQRVLKHELPSEITLFDAQAYERLMYLLRLDWNNNDLDKIMANWPKYRDHELFCSLMELCYFFDLDEVPLACHRWLQEHLYEMATEDDPAFLEGVLSFQLSHPHMSMIYVDWDWFKKGTLLSVVVAHKKRKLFDLLLLLGVEIDKKERLGHTALSRALERKDSEGVKWLVEAGAAIDERSLALAKEVLPELVKYLESFMKGDTPKLAEHE